MDRIAWICTLKGCEKPHYGHGYCRPHNRAFVAYGDPRRLRTASENAKAHAALDLPDCKCMVHNRGQEFFARRAKSLSEHVFTKKEKATTAAKISAANMGRTNAFAGLTKEDHPGLMAISAANRHRYEDPAERRRTSVATKAGWTPEARARLGAAIKKSYKDGSRKYSKAVIQSPSGLEWLAYDLLLSGFEVVVPQERFGPYSVDFLLAEEWLAVEVDGTYWHALNLTDYEARDKWLLEEFGLPVVRLAETEIRVMTS